MLVKYTNEWHTTQIYHNTCTKHTNIMVIDFRKLHLPSSDQRHSQKNETGVQLRYFYTKICHSGETPGDWLKF